MSYPAPGRAAGGGAALRPGLNLIRTDEGMSVGGQRTGRDTELAADFGRLYAVLPDGNEVGFVGGRHNQRTSVRYSSVK
jgi:hypothetical protein